MLQPAYQAVLIFRGKWNQFPAVKLEHKKVQVADVFFDPFRWVRHSLKNLIHRQVQKLNQVAMPDKKRAQAAAYVTEGLGALQNR